MSKSIIAQLMLLSLMSDTNPAQVLDEAFEAFMFQQRNETKLKEMYDKYVSECGPTEINFNEFCIFTFMIKKEKEAEKKAAQTETTDEMPAGMPKEIVELIQKLKDNEKADTPKDPRDVITDLLGKPTAMGYVTGKGKVKMTDGDGNPIKGEKKKKILNDINGKTPSNTLTITVKKKKVKKAKPEATPEPEKEVV